MSEKIRQLAPQIWDEIEKAKSILLHCHYNPDCDSIGSVLATMQVLEVAGKKVTVIKGDSDLPKFAKYLPGNEKIVAKNYFEIDLSEFDLFLALDSASLDRISRAGEIIFPDNLMTVNIDHHATNAKYANINLVEDSYPATAQIMFDLFIEWGLNISPAAATCLLAGLSADTGGYKYRGTSVYTFAVASKLAAIAPDFSKTITAIDGSRSLGVVRFIGHVVNNLEVLFDGRAIVGAIDYETITKICLNPSDTHQTGASNFLRDIDGVEVSLLLVEESASQTGISSRSKNGEKYDVSVLMQKFGGGGHQMAAGATINKPLAEVKAELINALSAML